MLPEPTIAARMRCLVIVFFLSLGEAGGRLDPQQRRFRRLVGIVSVDELPAHRVVAKDPGRCEVKRAY
jgi:hypothetical protein